MSEKSFQEHIYSGEGSWMNAPMNDHKHSAKIQTRGKE